VAEDDQNLLNALRGIGVISVGGTQAPEAVGTQQPVSQGLVLDNLKYHQYNGAIGIDFSVTVAPHRYLAVEALLNRFLQLRFLSYADRLVVEEIKLGLRSSDFGRVRQAFNEIDLSGVGAGLGFLAAMLLVIPDDLPQVPAIPEAERSRIADFMAQPDFTLAKLKGVSLPVGDPEMVIITQTLLSAALALSEGDFGLHDFQEVVFRQNFPRVRQLAVGLLHQHTAPDDIIPMFSEDHPGEVDPAVLEKYKGIATKSVLVLVQTILGEELSVAT
jgi:hypothetical protein